MDKRPVLGLDFVGVISDYPEFFEILSNLWTGKVVVISYFDSKEELEYHLRQFNIRYDKAIAVPHNTSKAKIIEDENVDYYFDDSFSNHNDLPSKVGSFLVRGDGNFDFGKQLWRIDSKWRDNSNGN